MRDGLTCLIRADRALDWVKVKSKGGMVGFGFIAGERLVLVWSFYMSASSFQHLGVVFEPWSGI